MNPVGLTNAEQTQETSAAPVVHPLAPAGAVSCRIVVPATGEACGAVATGRIVWPDRTRTPACADCARLMDQKAQSTPGTGIVGFEPIDRPWAVGTKNNPSQFSCYDKAEADEPMFTLLARDPTAPAFVRAWAAKHGGEKPEKAAEARGIADAMEAWRKEHRE
jgi:hypothetical protein